MELVYSNGNISIYRYLPTIFKPFYYDMEPTTLMRRIRFAIDIVYGYSVYYMKVDNDYVGYCTITSGKNRRFWFAESKDIVIGPYYIHSQFRGKGYSTLLVKIVISELEKEWRKAYLYILNNNIASIRVVEKLNGHMLFHVHNTLFRRLIRNPDGEYGVYEIDWRKE